MKKLILLVALLTMVAFVSTAMAQQKAPAPAKPAGTVAPAPAPAPASEKPAKPAKPAKAEKFSGTVDKVDEAAKTIVVKGKKGDMTFAVDTAKITKGGKEMAIGDLKSGMSVSIEYKKEGDKMVASSVKASAPKAASKEKKEKPAEAKPAEAPKK